MNIATALALLAFAAANLILWSRLRQARSKVEALTRLANDHRTFVPDDLIDSPNRPTFERASAYWSAMMLRTIDEA